MIRCFVALDLPATVQQALAEFQKDLQSIRAPVAWVKPDKVHVTLKFLGDVTPDQVTALQTTMLQVAARSAPFALQPASCGAFPTLKQMRVIWVGLQGDMEQVHTLHHNVEQELLTLGFAPEDRPYRAHLTLGRVKGRSHLYQLQQALVQHQDFHAEAFDVSEVVLYKSELRPEGVRYTALFRAPFTGRSA